MYRGVSRAALQAKLNRRLCGLARPVIRDGPVGCRDWGVSRAALMYQASDNIRKMSRPRLWDEPGGCRPDSGVSRAALKRKTTKKDDELATPKRRRGEEEEEEEGQAAAKREANEVSWRCLWSGWLSSYGWGRVSSRGATDNLGCRIIRMNWR